MFEIVKRHWLPIVIALSIIVFIMIMNIDFFADTNDGLTPVETFMNNHDNHDGFPESSSEHSTIIVDVKGEVVKPGIYEMNADARIHDVIELAGGFSDEADQVHVNLAQKVQDEMMIIVPKIGESSSEMGASASTGLNAGKVRINYATQDEIETLSGIGPSKAQAIIQFRDEHGFFTSVEDLLQISGIGEKTLENIKEDIQVP